MIAKLKNDIGMGARGLKLHGILQNVPYSDARTHAAIELFGEAGLAITPHFGVNDYYKPDSPHLAVCPKQYGELSYAFALLAEYPDYSIVVAHAGGSCGWEFEALAEKVKERGWRHVYVDTSFKSADIMRRLVDLFGEDRVLFGTDYPFATVKYSIAACEKAFADRPDVADKVFYRNAARILRL
jgi:predicted TIM-barrel fold metal-dependent hydrolase